MISKGLYFADLFCGGGIVARQAHSMGVNAREWNGSVPESDLLRSCVLRRLRDVIVKGKLIGACLAPPCGSFSVAVSRKVKLRSIEEPWG